MEINPFTLTGYKSSEYFCDRDLETKRILNAVQNQRNITLISTRRMGKTGLILHAFSRLPQDKTLIPVYFDIMGTTSLSEFAEAFSSALLRSISKKEKAIQGFLKKMAALRPGLSFDPLNGEPRISLDIRNKEEAGLSLDLLFSLIAEDKRHFVIAIDEFQQITSYPEKNVEAILRSRIQVLNNMSMIFSGSRKHMLTEIFTKPSRPFFSSTEMMFLETIPRDLYFEFIRRHFTAKSKLITDNALERIEEYTALHTFYVQFLCNRLFASHKKVSAGKVDQCMQALLHENESIYASYLNLITRTQYKTLRAIALDGQVESPTSGSFLAKHSLGAASTVAQSVDSLLGKEFLQSESGVLSLQDKYFARWIRLKS